MQKWLLITGFSLVWLSSSSQQVLFKNSTGKLNPVSGFTNYVDCAVDMNGDHLDDVVRIGNKGMYIDYQLPDGHFSQHFFFMPIQAPPDWSLSAGDIDNNGYNDLLFGNSHKVSFVQANENGTFYQETVMPSFIFSQRSTFADIDNDGWLDAFVCNDTAQSIPYKNYGAGEMTEDTNLIHTANLPGNYAAIWTDYDNDGYTDLYITKCQQQAPPGHINRTNLLYRNNGDGSYSEAGAEAGLDDNAQSWSTSFEDFDNDGDFDAFIVNHDFQNRLFRNNGDGTFTDVISTSGINGSDLGAYENASGDFNNDGFMDIFAELTNELYLGNGDLTFSAQDLPMIPGAIADLNNDGFLDVLRNGVFWENEGNTNHWLKVFPVGTQSNKNGIGARVEAYGTWGRKIREVRSGQSYSPMSSLTTHFGLGPYEWVDSLIIHWPSGIVTHLQNLKTDTTYVIAEAPCILPVSEVSVLGNLINCPGDTAILIAPPGFSNYTWSNFHNGQSLEVGGEGTFYAFCTDSAGCISITTPVRIQKLIEKIPEIFNAEGNLICEGDTLILMSTPGENYTWSSGATGTPNIEVADPGMYTVSVDAVCFSGQLTSNPFEVIVLPASAPLANGAVISQGDSILITAEGENCQWYDQPIGGNLLAIGSAFQTSPLSSSVTYYVESHHFYPGPIQSGGKMDTTGSGGVASQAGYLLFEVWEPFTLLSVSVYVPPGSPLSTRFVLLWSEDAQLALKQFTMQPGWNLLELNFAVPVGKFSLRCPQGNLWRNTTPLDYPYPIGDVGRITSSNFGDSYYYFFYDWKIKKEDFECISDRIPVEVILSGSSEIHDQKTLLIFPNPVSENLFIQLKGDRTTAGLLSMSDLQGKLILNQQFYGEHAFQLNLVDLSSGIYFLKVAGHDYFETRMVIKL